MAIQHRADQWLGVHGSTDEVALQLIDAVAITDNIFDLSATDGYVEISALSLIPAGLVSEFLVRPAEASNDEIAVETRTAAGILSVILTPDYNQLEFTTVQGSEAIALTTVSPGQPGSAAKVIWQATDNRVVSVFGDTTLEEILAVANSLEIVDEATWRTAFPGVTDQAAEDALPPITIEAPAQTVPIEPQPVTTEAAVAPSGSALFVIPNDLPGYEPNNGAVATSQQIAEHDPFTISTLVGIRDGDTFNHVARVTTSVAPPTIATELVDLPNGQALIGRNERTTLVARQVAGQWVTVTVSSTREAEAMQLVKAIEIDGDGLLDFSKSGGWETLSQTTYEPAQKLFSATYAELKRPGSEMYVLVEAVLGMSVDHPLLLHVPDRMSPTTVNGVTGWVMAVDDVDGVYNTVIWQPEPNQTVFVSAHSIRVDELRHVAESLVVVDEATWKLANPGYTESPS